MKLLADENVHADIVAWLRSSGHDVLFATESLASSSDEAVLALATRQGRAIITEDPDFGELVFHQLTAADYGIVLIRLFNRSVQVRISRLVQVWPWIEPKITGNFIVIGEKKVRIRTIS
jgi:predicted nuclease of predicted toxin-antitoxin system